MAGGGVHVVVGAGQSGRAVAAALHRRGRAVRLVSRRGTASGAPPGAEVLAADVSGAEGARRAAAGAAVVYACAAPAYTHPERLPPLMASLAAGAGAAGARLVLMDNLYAYGPQDGRPLTEDTPMRPTGPKGRARAQVAEALLAAHAAGRLQVVIARASDFLGPGAPDSVLGGRAFRPLLGGRPVNLLGDPDQPHTYAYLPDVAEALAVLGERDEAPGHVWHVPGLEPRTTREVLAMAAAEAGRPLRVRSAGRALMAVAGLASPTMRALREVLYQFQQPWVVDHSRYAAAFGGSPTPLEDAVRATVDWYVGQAGTPVRG